MSALQCCLEVKRFAEMVEAVKAGPVDHAAFEQAHDALRDAITCNQAMAWPGWRLALAVSTLGMEFRRAPDQLVLFEAIRLIAPECARLASETLDAAAG